MGLPGLYDHTVETRAELHDEIAYRCPAVTNLKVIHDFGNAHPEISRGVLFRKKTIRQLHLVLCVAVDLESLGFHYLSRSSRFDSRSMSEIVNGLPNLKVLKLGNGDSDIIHDVEFQLASASLQQIDWSGVGKNNWITLCECPNLTRLLCAGSPYGIGVRPRGDDGEISLISQNTHSGEYFAGSTHFDGILEWNGRNVVFEGLSVPDSCAVSLLPW